MWFEVIVEDAGKEIKLSLPCEEQELKDSYIIVSCENSWNYENEDLTLKELNNLAQDIEDALFDQLYKQKRTNRKALDKICDRLGDLRESIHESL